MSVGNQYGETYNTEISKTKYKLHKIGTSIVAQKTAFKNNIILYLLTWNNVISFKKQKNF